MCESSIISGIPFDFYERGLVHRSLSSRVKRVMTTVPTGRPHSNKYTSLFVFFWLEIAQVLTGCRVIVIFPNPLVAALPLSAACCCCCCRDIWGYVRESVKDLVRRIISCPQSLHGRIARRRCRRELFRRQWRNVRRRPPRIFERHSFRQHRSRIEILRQYCPNCPPQVALDTLVANKWEVAQIVIVGFANEDFKCAIRIFTAEQPFPFYKWTNAPFVSKVPRVAPFFDCSCPVNAYTLD
jgi:hypothetical protein